LYVEIGRPKALLSQFPAPSVTILSFFELAVDFGDLDGDLGGLESSLRKGITP
jgi:hypothetical protein